MGGRAPVPAHLLLLLLLGVGLIVPVYSARRPQCMLDWIMLAGQPASRSNNQLISALSMSRLDESSVHYFNDYSLGVVLGLPRGLARHLKRCIVRSSECTAPLHASRLPCTVGTCTFQDDIGSVACVCPDGWSGSRCQEDIDECSSGYHGCQSPAICVNTAGSYKCQCPSGYRLQQDQCLDINECSSRSHGCHADATCANTDGSFTCTCRQGFHGNGKACSDDPCFASSDPTLCSLVHAVKQDNVKLRKRLTVVEKTSAQKIKTLTAKVEQCNSQLRSFSSTTSTALASIKQKVATEQQRVNGVVSQLRAIPQRISTLEGKANTQGTAIADEKKRVDRLSQRVTTLTSRLSAQEGNARRQAAASNSRIQKEEQATRATMQRLSTVEQQLSGYRRCFGVDHRQSFVVSSGCTLRFPLQRRDNDIGGP